MLNTPAVFDAEAQSAWTELTGPLVTYFRLRVKAWDVDDLVSEVKVRFIAAVDRNAPIVDRRRFAYGIARNVLLEHLRSPTKARTESLDDLVAAGRTPESAIIDAPQTDEPDDVLAALRACLGEVRDQDRRLILEYYSGDSTRENRSRFAVAEMLSGNAMHVRASRIRKILRDCVDQRLGRPGTPRQKSSGKRTTSGAPPTNEQ